MSGEEETVTVSVSILATAVRAGLQDGITIGTNCSVNYSFNYHRICERKLPSVLSLRIARAEGPHMQKENLRLPKYRV